MWGGLGSQQRSVTAAVAVAAAIAATNEWFPKKERALAIGIFNAGSNVGAILTPLIVPIIAVTLGWRWAFILTGLLTVVWLTAWLSFYRSPREKKSLSAEELAWIETDPAVCAAFRPKTAVRREGA